MKRTKFPIRNTGDGKRPWMLDLRSISGRREFYETKAMAEEARDLRRIEIERHGTEAVHLSHCDRLNFVQAQERLTKHNVTLDEVIGYYEKFHAVTEPILFSKAIEIFMAGKKGTGLNGVYVRKLKAHLEALMRHTGDRYLGTITQEEIEKWLFESNWEKPTIRNIRIDIRTFFKNALLRRWISENPALAIPPIKLEDSVPGILTPEQCATLMMATLKVREALPFVVLNLFCGIRPEEASKLSSANIFIARGYVEVPAKIAKSRQRRIVQLSENAKEWLKMAGEVVAKNPKWYARQIPKLQIAAIRITNIPLPWPKNCLRHCFASYHLALHGSADKTSTEMGHRSTDMLFRHYRELVTKQDAEKFWNIRPISLVPEAKPKAPAKTVHSKAAAH